MQRELWPPHRCLSGSSWVSFPLQFSRGTGHLFIFRPCLQFLHPMMEWGPGLGHPCVCFARVSPACACALLPCCLSVCQAPRIARSYRFVRQLPPCVQVLAGHGMRYAFVCILMAICDGIALRVNSGFLCTIIFFCVLTSCPRG